jgi:hypothetical protein
LLSTSIEANSYQWYFNGNIIEGANEQEYNATEEGDYSIIIVDKEGCIIESEVFIYVISGVEDSEQIQCRFYPNPATDFITFENFGKEKLDYTISNSNGQIVRKGQIGFNKMVVDISNISNGVYTIQMKDGNLTRSNKLIKI